LIIVKIQNHEKKSRVKIAQDPISISPLNYDIRNPVGIIPATV
jgi:hypothetical protein